MFYLLWTKESFDKEWYVDFSNLFYLAVFEMFFDCFGEIILELLDKFFYEL